MGFGVAMETDVRWIPPGEAKEAWAAFLPAIRRGLTRAGGDLTASSLLEAAQSGALSLWSIELGGVAAGIAVIEVIDRPARAAVSVILVAGRGMAGWIGPALGALERYRVLNGAHKAEAVCRPGMARLLRRMGWRPKGVIMESGGA